jgi:hypothetical protein
VFLSPRWISYLRYEDDRSGVAPFPVIKMRVLAVRLHRKDRKEALRQKGRASLSNRLKET